MSLDMTPARHDGATTARSFPRRYTLRDTVRPRVGPVAKVAARRPDGSLICISDLPEAGLRWTRLRKRAVVECVGYGLIRADAVCARYGLSPEELAEWQETVARGGRTPIVWRQRPRARDAGVVQLGSAEIDLDGRELRVDGSATALAPSEWRLLSVLAEADGAVVSNAMLMGSLYASAETAAGPKIADVLVCRLRKKLGSEAERIDSVWGRGYRLSV